MIFLVIGNLLAWGSAITASVILFILLRNYNYSMIPYLRFSHLTLGLFFVLVVLFSLFFLDNCLIYYTIFLKQNLEFFYSLTSLTLPGLILLTTNIFFLLIFWGEKLKPILLLSIPFFLMYTILPFTTLISLPP
ncbi:MAG: hypothetical protein DRP87_06735 [Spirochaetes bacterium]|nr:MAG: hypothetical protein DRP87_06735 [Spirochaetota bacterium]